MLELENNVVSKNTTAPNDLMFKIVDAPMWFHSLNIRCLTHPVFYGDRTEQQFPMYVNEVVYSEHPINLNEIYFINQGAGNNGKVIAVGALMLKSEMKRLGIPTHGI